MGIFFSRLECPLELMPVKSEQTTATFYSTSQAHLRRLAPKYANVSNSLGQSIDPPINLEEAPEAQQCLNEASSRYMASFLDFRENYGLAHEKSDVLISAGALQCIANSVFHRERKWRLRAFLEVVKDRRAIIITRDDINGVNCGQLRSDADVEKEKMISLLSSDETRNCRWVLSRIQFRGKTAFLNVFGEFDAISDEALNVAVLTNNGRSCKFSLSTTNQDKIDECFVENWSRSFLLGVHSILLGIRRDDDQPIECVRRQNLHEFWRFYNSRNDRAADLSIACVAQAIFSIRAMFDDLGSSRYNIIACFTGEMRLHVEYYGYSFWLIREKYYIENSQKEPPKKNLPIKNRIFVMKKAPICYFLKEDTMDVGLEIEI
ncbi:unnamed protein product [Caenorhabditis bovis]|uniref:Uncharacterized protein n=1 Tax=Caenorhabditis bovis TaxID=2654633 RepID=A0A8S1EZ08_9PELO|nr:unnamed protein product [Caenorhabditis bovis]